MVSISNFYTDFLINIIAGRWQNNFSFYNLTFDNSKGKNQN